MTYDSDNPYPDGAPVLVRYPRDKAEEKASRDTWPWLPGTIVQRCGPDEWQVCVEAPRAGHAGGWLTRAGRHARG